MLVLKLEEDKKKECLKMQMINKIANYFKYKVLKLEKPRYIFYTVQVLSFPPERHLYKILNHYENDRYIVRLLNIPGYCDHVEIVIDKIQNKRIGCGMLDRNPYTDKRVSTETFRQKYFPEYE